MKKYLILALFCLFWLLHTNDVFWTVAPVFPARYQEMCSMITDINVVDWYKLVSVSWFSWDIKEVRPFTCLKWFIFLVPEDLDISTLKTVEWPDEDRKNYPGYFKSSWDLQSSTPWFFWTDYMWSLDNDDAMLVWKLIDKYSYFLDYEKPSHLLVLNELESKKNWKYWLHSYYSISYEYNYVYYVIWWIVLVCWIVWYIRKRRKGIKAV